MQKNARLILTEFQFQEHNLTILPIPIHPHRRKDRSSTTKMVLAGCGSGLGGIIIRLIIAGITYRCKIRNDRNKPQTNQQAFEMPSFCSRQEEEEEEPSSSLPVLEPVDINLFSIDSDSNESLDRMRIIPYSIENPQYISDTLSETATGYSTTIETHC